MVHARAEAPLGHDRFDILGEFFWTATPATRTHAPSIGDDALKHHVAGDGRFTQGAGVAQIRLASNRTSRLRGVFESNDASCVLFVSATRFPAITRRVSAILAALLLSLVGDFASGASTRSVATVLTTRAAACAVSDRGETTAGRLRHRRLIVRGLWRLGYFRFWLWFRFRLRLWFRFRFWFWFRRSSDRDRRQVVIHCGVVFVDRLHREFFFFRRIEHDLHESIVLHIRQARSRRWGHALDQVHSETDLNSGGNRNTERQWDEKPQHQRLPRTTWFPGRAAARRGQTGPSIARLNTLSRHPVKTGCGAKTLAELNLGGVRRIHDDDFIEGKEP
jgi:hypothetical protein